MKNVVYFPAFKTYGIGVWFFVPNDIKRFNKGKSCKGFGQIKYPEGSIYLGEIYFDGKEFNKIGFGRQDFSLSNLSFIEEDIGEKKYMFVGQYNYKVTSWICGNGVLYYVDKYGKPTHFVKGYFHGLDIVGDYVGEFDYNTLLDGYTKDMEFDHNPRYSLFKKEMKNLENVTNLNTLFIGDSYFEFWHYPQFAGKTFYESFDNKEYLNLGLGGTRFYDWIHFVDFLKDLPQMKKIVINLGFNDLHSNKSINETYKNFNIVLKKLNGMFPETEIYLLNVVHSPGEASCYNLEKRFNNFMLKKAQEHNINIIDISSVVEKEQERINCFADDLIHLNEHGYELLYKILKENNI